jgi:hypothetical protein
LIAALTEYQPDAVLIEGPADADPLLHWVLAEGMTPPLALLGYAPDHPQTAAFWPYAIFSPEWQAMRYALQHNIEVGFCDLPASAMLARWSRRRLPEDESEEPDEVPDESPPRRRPSSMIRWPCSQPQRATTIRSAGGTISSSRGWIPLRPFR